MPNAPAKPLHVRLSDEGRERLTRSLRAFFDDEFEQSLSEFQAQRLVEFLVSELGAPIYNQAIQDARRFLQEKLEDLEGEFYEPVNS